MENITKKRLRIGIDARFYGPVGKGLGRYVQEVVDNILRINHNSQDKFEFVVFLSQDNFDQFVCADSLVSKKLVSLPWYSWREQLLFPLIIRKAKLNLMHYPHFNVPIFSPVAFVVTIHDLILTRFPSRRASMLPSTLYWFKQIAYRIIIQVAVIRAKAIITVSHFTKNDIVKQLGVRADKIVVTYEGVATLNSAGEGKENIAKLSDDNQVLKHYQFHRPFLLYVGNAYPHKNLDKFLEVFADLRHHHPSISLVMVGKDDYFYQRVKQVAKHLQLWRPGADDNQVFFPGYVSDEDLKTLYRQALLYVFPSLYEGFGLPPLEAMSQSCPVISSNQGSLPEVLGSAAAYFNPYDKEDMLIKISALIDNKVARDDLIVRGREHIKSFSWQQCSSQTLDVYKQILLK
ncbi:glycosyltransferase family 4 protein [Patescibacteria group bacterium]|nr:glycosyltransferase family 4 protein [Patescibacteria group bacterium]